MPSLSEITAWDTTHLENAARDWKATAQHWESAFTSIHQAAVAPGGTAWEGAAAEAAQGATLADLVKVRGWADVLHESAAVARHGASTLLHAKQSVLYAVEDARAAGYSVNEDLSVTPPPEAGEAGEAQAQTYATNIHERATQLAAHDKEIAGKLTTATAPLHHVGFADDEERGDPTIQAVDSHTGPEQHYKPQTDIDPRNPFVGDERFGHWVQVVPPPYVGSSPPPPWTGHHPLEGVPTRPAGPSGFYVPGGQPWADDNAPPFAYRTEQYKFRISGEDYTGYTRMVNGHQQQWVQYTYEARRFTQDNIAGPAWAPKGPNQVTGELGGVMTGGLSAINPPPRIYPWHPITPHEIATLSAENPNATYYIPNGCGGQFTFNGGVPTGGIQPPPKVPSMIAAD